MKHLQTLSLLLSIMLLAGAAAAHPKNKDKDKRAQYHGGSIDPRQHGYEHGYRDGFHHGREDRARNAAYDLKNEEDYKHGDRGYEKYMGSKDQYKKGYREGYQAGYDDAFNNRPGRWAEIYHIGPEGAPAAPDRSEDIYQARGFRYADVAYDIGYRDGLSIGAKDARDGKVFNPEDHAAYKDADHGYRDSYGSKDDYRRSYRDGYMAGYQDGFGPRR